MKKVKEYKIVKTRGYTATEYPYSGEKGTTQLKLRKYKESKLRENIMNNQESFGIWKTQ